MFVMDFMWPTATATTQVLKDEAKTAALLGLASGGNPAAMGAVMCGNKFWKRCRDMYN